MKQKAGKRSSKEIKQLLDASYEDNPPEKINGFILDKKLSKKTAKVYFNPETKEAVVSHRGTQGLSDWKNNVAHVVGLYEKTDRYKKGKKIQEKAEKKYGSENISTLGHSQGSILASKLGKNTKEIINVNSFYLGGLPSKNEYNIRSSKDVVSSLYAPVAKIRKTLYPKKSEKDITIPAETNDILTEHSYNILDRIPDKIIGGKRFNNLEFSNIDELDFLMKK
jgi:hypothetical protein